MHIAFLAGTNTNGKDWMKQFIQGLVEISHTQWLYQNFTIHHYAKGYLHQRTAIKISREVELLADTRPSNIPQGSRYLLVLLQRPLHSSSPVHSAYWVPAMKAAKTSLKRKEVHFAGQGTRSRQQEQHQPCNLLEGVQESLYNCLLLCERRTKQNHDIIQTSAVTGHMHPWQRGRTLFAPRGNKPKYKAVKAMTPFPCKQALCEEINLPGI
jgi:hypothetical protein